MINTLEAHDGALPCLPVTDTLKRAREGRITGTVERDQLWRAQTPQGFRVAGPCVDRRVEVAEGLGDRLDPLVGGPGGGVRLLGGGQVAGLDRGGQRRDRLDQQAVWMST